MHTVAGIIGTKTLVHLAADVGQKIIGMMKLFVNGRSKATFDKSCFVIFQAFEKVDEFLWKPIGLLSIAAAECIIRPLPYVVAGECVCPLIPEHGIH